MYIYIFMYYINIYIYILYICIYVGIYCICMNMYVYTLASPKSPQMGGIKWYKPSPNDRFVFGFTTLIMLVLCV